MPSNSRRPPVRSPRSLLARDVGEAIVRLTATIDTAFAEATADTGLTQLEARLLRAAEASPSQGELAGILGVDAARVSTLTRALEERGLLRRVRGRGDRRIRRSELTDAGHAVVAQIGRRLSALSPLPGGLDDEQLVILRALLAELESDQARRAPLPPERVSVDGSGSDRSR